MFRHLHITNRRERWLVGLADLALRVLTAAGRLLGAARPVERTPPRRILLVRLERVGDLLMVLDAMAMVRELAPSARIDLVVGRWNAALAGIIPGIDSVDTLDAPWMARAGAGQSWPALLRHAWGWRRRRYDLAINFESDIRSNLLLWLSGARRRVGFESGGGGPLLTDAVVADRTEHVAANASLLVARAFDQPAAAAADVPGRQLRRKQRLDIPAAARQRATALLADVDESERLVGLQPGAGRQLREWDPARFGAVAKELARGGPVTFVLTGSAADAAALAGVTTTWPRDLRLIVLPVDTDLVVLAAVIERLSLFITGDTGPMHLAAALGTPIVAIFGPSLPSRYAPLSGDARIVRIDLPCSPCNRLREPPARCVGHVPDCLAGIEPAQVVQAANELLGRGATQWPLRALDATPS